MNRGKKISRAFGRSSLLWALLIMPCSSFALDKGDDVDPSLLEALDYQEGTILWVDFFAEWCESCRKELPLISALNTRLEKQLGDKVQFIGVDIDDELAAAERFQQSLKVKGALNFPVINDLDQAIVQQFKPLGFPALYMINDGVIVAAHVGAMPNVDLVIEQELQQFLKD